MTAPRGLTELETAAEPSAWLAARGHAIVETGPDQGVETLAVWQVTPEGLPSGAWVVPVPEAFGNPETARRLLTCVERRVLVSLGPGEAEEAASRLCLAAGVEVTASWWSKVTLRLPDLLAEITEQRHRFEKTVAEERARNKQITSLEWQRRLPATLPTDFKGLQGVSGIATPSGSPPVSAALLVSRLLRWLIGVWAETEQTKGRRSYIHDRFGAPTTLPAGWTELLTRGHEQVSPL